MNKLEKIIKDSILDEMYDYRVRMYENKKENTDNRQIYKLGFIDGYKFNNEVNNLIDNENPVMFRIFNNDNLSFREMISNQKLKLKKYDFEYKKILKEVEKIKQKNKKINQLYDGEAVELSKNDCEILQKLITLQYKIMAKEEKSIYALGASEVLKGMKFIEEMNN